MKHESEKVERRWITCTRKKICLQRIDDISVWLFNRYTCRVIDRTLIEFLTTIPRSVSDNVKRKLSRESPGDSNFDHGTFESTEETGKKDSWHYVTLHISEEMSSRSEDSTRKPGKLRDGSKKLRSATCLRAESPVLNLNTKRNQRQVAPNTVTRSVSLLSAIAVFVLPHLFDNSITARCSCTITRFLLRIPNLLHAIKNWAQLPKQSHTKWSANSDT